MTVKVEHFLSAQLQHFLSLRFLFLKPEATSRRRLPAQAIYGFSSSLRSGFAKVGFYMVFLNQMDAVNFMVPFPFQLLPEDIQIRIVQLLGADGAKHLSPLMMSGKIGREAVLKDEVLKDLPLNEFLIQPSLAFPVSSARHFFNRCVDANNETACYLEGIRLIIQDGRIVQGLRTITSLQTTTPHIKFAMGIILLCHGFHDLGMHMIRCVEEDVQCFATVREYGAQLVEHMLEMRVRENFVHNRNWGVRWTRANVPMCVNNPCTREAPCPQCYVFWIAYQVGNLA